MSKKNENKLVPRLRFPEFINTESWKEATLGQITDYENGKAHEQDIKERGHFIVVNSKFISSDGEVKKYTDTASCPTQRGDILMVLSDVPNGKAIAKCFLVEKDKLYTVNQRICRITPNNLNSKILYYLLNRNPYFLAFDDGVKQTNLRKEDVLNCALIIPSDPNEQQKIASCLSSLDEVITAEKEKLEVLKEHKKGLLQNLFPLSELGFTGLEDDKMKKNTGKKILKSKNLDNPNSDNVPKLRFKEFEDSGEWEIKELHELGFLINGLTYSPEDVRDKGLLVLRSSNIQDGIIDLKDCVYVKEDIKGANLIEKKDILVCVRNGSKNLIGKNAIIPDDIQFATHGAFMTVFRANNPDFVYQLFQTDYYDKQVKADLGATINSINGRNFIKYEFPVPKNPKEQQKIAGTLSSIDELINAQGQKIETLQLHKKGLLQGLFPTLVEAFHETPLQGNNIG